MLKARAARTGRTLSDYLLEMVERELARPEPREVLARIRERGLVYLEESPAASVREERESV